MKGLILVNSVYQLITAIQIQRTFLKGAGAELLLTDITPSLKDYGRNLEKLHLFDRILYGETKELSRKYAVGKEEEIKEGFRNREQIFRWILSDSLASYDQVYFSNFDTFTRMLACKYDASSCEFICFEDGFSTYVIDYLREDRASVNRTQEGRKIKEKLKKVLLYEPHLAVRQDTVPNEALPKISREDTELKEILNQVFDYKKPDKMEGFLFLEQSFRAEGIVSNELDLIRSCRELSRGKPFRVKPHPRNTQVLPYRRGIAPHGEKEAPWELYLLNEEPEKLVLLTVCSNGALTGRLLFGMDIPTVMLYPLFEGRVLWKEDELLKEYLEKFRRQFAGRNYYVPQTIYELKSILEYLGGSYGQ